MDRYRFLICMAMIGILPYFFMLSLASLGRNGWVLG
jgi:hypothetical protein